MTSARLATSTSFRPRTSANAPQGGVDTATTIQFPYSADETTVFDTPSDSAMRGNAEVSINAEAATSEYDALSKLSWISDRPFFLLGINGVDSVLIAATEGCLSAPTDIFCPSI